MKTNRLINILFFSVCVARASFALDPSEPLSVNSNVRIDEILGFSPDEIYRLSTMQLQVESVSHSENHIIVEAQARFTGINCGLTVAGLWTDGCLLPDASHVRIELGSASSDTSHSVSVNPYQNGEILFVKDSGEPIDSPLSCDQYGVTNENPLQSRRLSCYLTWSHSVMEAIYFKLTLPEGW